MLCFHHAHAGEHRVNLRLIMLLLPFQLANESSFRLLQFSLAHHHFPTVRGKDVFFIANMDLEVHDLFVLLAVDI